MKDTMGRILSQLIDLQQKPEPFTPGEALFWDDPHISSQLLALHLDPDIEAASRKPGTIDRSVDWLTETLELEAAASLLDLGCGPGLYASRFAQAGFHVTGVDYSRRSIEYAKEYASKKGLNIAYRYQDYLGIADENRYHAAFLIYGDFCVLSPEDRSTLLENVHRALKPNGHFVLDVSTRVHRKSFGNRNRWYASEGGFWRPGPYLVLEEGFDYPEQSIWLDQYTVIEANGKASVYRNWFQDYTPETISEELSCARFSVESLWADLTGRPYTPDSEWIGVIAGRR